MGKLVGLLIIIVVVVGGGAAGVWYSRHSSEPPVFRTATITRGDLSVTTSATGTIEPEETVDVGAQVAGKIMDFGKDTNGNAIDYGSKVVENQIIAHIDPTLYQSDLASAQALLEANKAAVTRAIADLGQLKAKLTQAERDWARAQKLGPSDALSQADYDSYQSAYDVAKANVAVGDAAIEQAQKTVAQTEASMARAKQNLDYCTILSPVDGVVIDRRVNVGQTIVSSLNAPSLFLLARDLSRMEVWAQVNEADIGQIKVGMPVTFTTEAFSGKTFTGKVLKIRFLAQTTQSVVTYIVEVTTENSSGLLLPYLSANVSFQINKFSNALLVPNSALRYYPRQELISPDAQAEMNNSAGGSGGGMGGGHRDHSGATGPTSGPTSRPGRGQRMNSGTDTDAPHPGTLWVQDGKFVKPITVRLGATDGIDTVVLSDNVKEDQVVITGEQREDSTSGPAPGSSTGMGGNPFLPQMPGRGGQRPGGGGAGGGTGGNRGGGR